MKLILTPIIIVLCIIAGTAGGYFLKSGNSDPSTNFALVGADDYVGETDSTNAKLGDVKKKDKGDAHAQGHGKSDNLGSGETYYFNFTREFVVPIMQGGRVKSLVILNINLEADASQSETLFSLEPKLRDNIMTSLIELSNDGVTLENITSVENYETIRSVVLMNLNSTVSRDIKNVLILDVGKQNL